VFILMYHSGENPSPLGEDFSLIFRNSLCAEYKKNAFGERRKTCSIFGRSL